MKKALIALTAACFMLSIAALAFAQGAPAAKSENPKVVRERTAVLTATVEKIDLANRVVTLKGPKGEVRDIKIGPEARNLDQVKPGDVVTVKYLQSIAAEVIKPGAATGAGESSTIVRSKPGELPGGAAARQATVTANVTAIDKKKGTITLKGPEGKTVEVKVLEPKNLDKVKVGDDLMITYTEALAISVERAKKK